MLAGTTPFSHPIFGNFHLWKLEVQTKIHFCHIGFQEEGWVLICCGLYLTWYTQHTSQVPSQIWIHKIQTKLQTVPLSCRIFSTEYQLKSCSKYSTITNLWLNNHIESVYNWIYLEGMQCISKINTRQPLLILSNVNHSYLCMQMKKKQSFSETFLYLLWKLRNLMP